MYKNLLIIFLLISFAGAASAQTSSPDTTKTKKDIQNRKRDSVTSKRFVPKVTKDKEKVYHPDSTHSPHLAVVRSLMIPGWGQIYNHQWWKVPIIYAGLGLLADAIIFNQKNYAPNLIVARYYEHAVTPTPNDPQYALWALYQQYGVQAQTVYDIVDSYDRDRDLSIFGFLGAWGIQAIDAYIDAKFQHSYTMDTNFSFKVEPMFNQPVYAQNLNGAFISGIKVTLRF
jgi:hypothetical protein